MNLSRHASRGRPRAFPVARIVVLCVLALSAGIVAAVQMAEGSRSRPPCLADGCRDLTPYCTKRVCPNRSVSIPTTPAPATSTGASADGSSADAGIRTNLAQGQTVRDIVQWEAVPVGTEADRIEFTIDGAMLHTEYSAPYQYRSGAGWNTTAMPNGTHTLSVRMYALDGEVASAEVSVQVQNAEGSASGTAAGVTTSGPTTSAPSVTTDLREGQVLGGTVQWHAYPVGAAVDRVEFTIDGGLLSTERAAPYRYRSASGWDTTSAPDGPHRLDIRVITTDGRTVATTGITVRVENTVLAATPTPTPPPVPTVKTNLSEGQIVTGTVPWEAYPAGAVVDRVEFTIDGASLHTERTAPYQYGGGAGWDTTTVPNGTHRLTVLLVTADGRAFPLEMTVRVQNQLVQQAVAAPPPAATGTFKTLPPGSALPTGQECAARVRPAREVRPENAAANATTAGSHRLTYVNGVNYDRDPSNITPAARSLVSRIDGNFTGTTDEILQWGACKWGFDEEVLRAVAVTESTWRQSENGDGGQSFGLLQIKVTIHGQTWPWAKDSTAFNVDYALAWRRLMFEGHMSDWVPPAAVGDEMAGISMWYAGDWNWTAGREGYLAAVRKHLAEKPWLTW